MKGILVPEVSLPVLPVALTALAVDKGKDVYMGGTTSGIKEESEQPIGSLRLAAPASCHLGHGAINLIGRARSQFSPALRDRFWAPHILCPAITRIGAQQSPDSDRKSVV